MLKRYQPYTFRGRMMIALYVSAIFSAVVSLLFAYVISHVNVQSELQLQQQALGVYLLEMDNRTDLSMATMLGMVNDVEDTHVDLLDVNGILILNENIAVKIRTVTLPLSSKES